MPSEAEFTLEITPPEHQVTVLVVGPNGKPLEGATVKLYNRLPFTFIAEAKTDENGKAYFDGLMPWKYILAADYEPENLTTPPECFDIPLGMEVKHFFKLKATPPPHEYIMKIQCGWAPIAGLAEWLVENVSLIRDTIIGYPNHEFIEAYVKDSTLYIRFRVTGSPFPWAAVGALLVILALLAIIGWELMEITKAIPKTTWILIGGAAAVLAISGLVSAVRGKK
jgi:hypothetical protein